MEPEETPLDAAHRAMEAEPDDPQPRLRFYERVLDAELHVLLETEAEEDRLRPRVFDLEAGRYVLAFDRDARLAAFLDAPAPYAALAGRRLAALLAGQGIGIALNPGVAPSEYLLPAEAVDWLAGTAEARGEVAAARARGIGPPRGADAGLIAALDSKLAAMAGRIEAAWLAELRLEDRTRRLALAVAGAPEAAERAVAVAIAEAVRFSGTEDGLDVTFVGAEGPARAAFERVGLRFELPKPPAPPEHPQPPGTDPERPPILRRGKPWKGETRRPR